jgi:hypothetical protein
MLHMCVCMHSRFVENQPIQILEDGPLISEVVLSQVTQETGGMCYITKYDTVEHGLMERASEGNPDG